MVTTGMTLWDIGEPRRQLYRETLGKSDGFGLEEMAQWVKEFAANAEFGPQDGRRLQKIVLWLPHTHTLQLNKYNKNIGRKKKTGEV